MGVHCSSCGEFPPVLAAWAFQGIWVFSRAKVRVFGCNSGFEGVCFIFFGQIFAPHPKKAKAPKPPQNPPHFSPTTPETSIYCILGQLPALARHGVRKPEFLSHAGGFALIVGSFLGVPWLGGTREPKLPCGPKSEEGEGEQGRQIYHPWGTIPQFFFRGPPLAQRNLDHGTCGALLGQLYQPRLSPQGCLGGGMPRGSTAGRTAGQMAKAGGGGVPRWVVPTTKLPVSQNFR